MDCSVPHPLWSRSRHGIRSLPWRVVAVAVLCGAICACVTPLRRADQLFAAGAYPEAVLAYEQALADLDATDRDRARLHLALAYALPESPLHDPKRARRLLGELAGEGDSSPYKAQAKALLELERLRSSVARLEGAARRSKTSSRELEASLAEAREELARCERQLEELKRIDLGG